MTTTCRKTESQAKKSDKCDNSANVALHSGRHLEIWTFCRVLKELKKSPRDQSGEEKSFPDLCRLLEDIWSTWFSAHDETKRKKMRKWRKTTAWWSDLSGAFSLQRLNCFRAELITKDSDFLTTLWRCTKKISKISLVFQLNQVRSIRVSGFENLFPLEVHLEGNLKLEVCTKLN